VTDQLGRLLLVTLEAARVDADLPVGEIGAADAPAADRLGDLLD